MIRRIGPLSAAILVAGLAWVLLLQGTSSEEVFFNGDGGIKFLMTRQLAAGDLAPNLKLEAPSWARDLWASGLYPFHPPVVYELNGRVYPQYPLFFPFVSAPFYRLFGSRGLLVIPFASLILLWITLAWTCGRLGLSRMGTAAALGTAVLGSHLTPYGAMFWEHAPATALATAGLATLLLGGPGAFLGGLAGGLSVWFRSEFLLFTGLLGLAAFAIGWSRRRNRGHLRPALHFAAGLTLSVAAYLIANRAMTGFFLGLHSWQTRFSMTPAQKLALYPEVAHWLLRDIVLYFPAVLVPLVFLVCSVARRRAAWIRPFALLLTLGAADMLFIPLLVPSGAGREWGPRYLLVLVPIVALLTGLAVDRARETLARPTALVVAAAVVATLALGAWRNVAVGTGYLIHAGRTRVAPALEQLLASRTVVGVVSRQWISQDLAAAIGPKILFRASTFADIARLASALHRRGIGEFLYLSLPGEPVPPSMSLPQDPAAPVGYGEAAPRVTFSPAGQLGQFKAWTARIG